MNGDTRNRQNIYIDSNEGEADFNQALNTIEEFEEESAHTPTSTCTDDSDNDDSSYSDHDENEMYVSVTNPPLPHLSQDMVSKIRNVHYISVLHFIA